MTTAIIVRPSLVADATSVLPELCVYPIFIPFPPSYCLIVLLDVYKRQAVQIIEKAKSSGEISNPSSARDMAFTLYDALRGISVTWAAENGNFDIESYYLCLLYTSQKFS